MEIEPKFIICLVINIFIILTLISIKYIANLTIDPHFYELVYIFLMILFYVFFYFLVMSSCKNINCNVLQ